MTPRPNTWDNVFYDYGFTIKRRAYNVSLYHHKVKDVWAQVDEKLLTLEVGDLQMRYSVRDLINYLNENNFKA
jgi:hypothetical protein